MNQSSIRKGRIMMLQDGNNILLFKIKNSKETKLPQINFDIFNIPVICVEIETNKITSESKKNLELQTILETHKDILVKDDKYYVPISKLKFPNEEQIKLYQKA